MTFTALGPNSYGEMDFQCELLAEGFSGLVSGSSMYRNSLSEYFISLAADWRGWAGEKSWMNDGVEIRLDATADRLGHIKLGVTLSTYNETRLYATIMIDCGLLDQIAADLKRIIG